MDPDEKDADEKVVGEDHASGRLNKNEDASQSDSESRKTDPALDDIEDDKAVNGDPEPTEEKEKAVDSVQPSASGCVDDDETKTDASPASPSGSNAAPSPSGSHAAPSETDDKPKKVRKPVAKKRTGGGPRSSAAAESTADAVAESTADAVAGSTADAVAGSSGAAESVPAVTEDNTSKLSSSSKPHSAGPKSSKKRKLEDGDDSARDPHKNDDHDAGNGVGKKHSSSSPESKRGEKKKKKKRSSSPKQHQQKSAADSDSEGSCAEFSPSGKDVAKRSTAEDDDPYPDSNMDNIHSYQVDDIFDDGTSKDETKKSSKSKKESSDFDPRKYCLSYSGSSSDKKPKGSSSKSYMGTLSPVKV